MYDSNSEQWTVNSEQFRTAWNQPVLCMQDLTKQL
jgi:hypothetical protein